MCGMSYSTRFFHIVNPVSYLVTYHCCSPIEVCTASIRYFHRVRNMYEQAQLSSSQTMNWTSSKPSSNRQRTKGNEQVGREADALMGIEKERAKRRMAEQAKANLKQGTERSKPEPVPALEKTKRTKRVATSSSLQVCIATAYRLSQRIRPPLILPQPIRQGDGKHQIVVLVFSPGSI
jgi:hypothetical protein